MKSRTTQDFWRAYYELPAEIRTSARKVYALFCENPGHPSLSFKRVHDREEVFSVRITRAHRALGLVEDGEVTWFWIGNHAGYDRLLTRL